VFVGAALDDAEQRLVGASVGFLAALQPGERPPHAFCRDLLSRRVGCTLIEGHDDVRTKSVLDLDRALGGQLQYRAIEFVLEANAPIADLLVRQREDLEAPAVREDRAVPGREGVQPAHLLDECLAWAERQVIGVREHHLGTGRTHLRGRHRAHGALGADDHEGRRMHVAVRRGEGSGARGAVACLGREREFGCHAGTVAAP
jgi:hypothetical protein